MGFLDELKRLARPYEDEEEEEEFDDFEPVSRSERMDRTGGDRLERKAPKAQDSTGPSSPWRTSAGATRWSISTPPPSFRWCW